MLDNETESTLVQAITDHIAKVVVKKIEDDFIDPFQSRVDAKLDSIHSQIRKNEELFSSNVTEAVKRSRRELIEDRIKEFDVANLIEKLTSIPEQISNASTNSRALRQVASNAKDTYEVELRQLVTVAGQQGMVGGNAEDRKAISQLIEDRVRNVKVHGSVVNLVFQSEAKDKSLMECSNLDLSRASEAYENWQTNARLLDDAEVDAIKLDNQFKALRQVASLVTSLAS